MKREIIEERIAVEHMRERRRCQPRDQTGRRRAQNENNLPRSGEIRARFVDTDVVAGDWSDIVTVQTLP